MGIDWGTGTNQDETAICVFNSNKEMVALHHFSDKDETSTIEYIVELIKQYKPLRCEVETNSIGQVFYGLLDKAIKSNRLQTMLTGFTTTNESKERLINNFQVAIQRKEVTILDDITLKIQMDMYEMKVNNNGKHTYNAPSGYHDDCIIAMLLAFDCISTGIYHIR
jgi:ATP-dependent 26S proteasome regulatory subunit